MSQLFEPGDFLIFQLESGYGLLRVLAVDDGTNGTVWHLIAYSDLFLDVEMAEDAIADAPNLAVSHPHLALTNRAFESTQVSKIGNALLRTDDLAGFDEWVNTKNGEVSDRSVRLMLGLR